MDHQDKVGDVCKKVLFRNTEIYIGYGYLNTIPMDILSLLERKLMIAIISDTTVGRLYGQVLLTLFQRLAEVKCTLIIQPQNNAISHVKERIKQISEDLFIVSLGGSSVRRLTKTIIDNCENCVGFSHISTTLRDCIDLCDAQIQVKDVKGKNHQPKRVYIDLEVLQKLPRRHIMSGMGEIIKVAAVNSNGWRKWVEQIVENYDDLFPSQGDDLLDFIERNSDQLYDIQREAVMAVVLRTIEIKLKIVSEALDKDNPVILNTLKLGHSIGDALETLMIPELLRGECISIGMVKEAAMCGEGICSSSTVGRLVRCLKRFELPTRIPHHLHTRDIMAIKTFPKNVTTECVELVLAKQITVVTGKKASGTIKIPGSKSISNRVLIMAAMGHGICHISGLLHSDDTHVMINALEQIGAKFRWIDNDVVLVVQGTGGKLRLVDANRNTIFVNHSGTSARFLTSLLTLVEGKPDQPIFLTGSSRLKERPIGPLVDALRNVGCKIEYLQTIGCLPLAIYNTGLKGSFLHLSGIISSTFVTSVLLSAPYASSSMTVELAEENPTSLQFILMTIQLMAKFNVHVEQHGLNRFTIPSGAYENPSHIEIEVDASSATYPLSMAAVTGGTVCIHGLGEHSLQGDAKFYLLLQSMGCTASQSDNCTTVSGPLNGVLRSVDINMESMTDAFMTAAILAGVAHGTSRITGVANQRVKECNRIGVMVKELRKIGISCGELDDGIWVEGIGTWSLEEKQQKLKKAFIACNNDHRIAMSFAVLGCVLDEIIITDKDCTEKTYPQFWEDLRSKLGLNMRPVFESYSENNFKVAVAKPLSPCIFVIGMRGSGKSILGMKVSQTFQLKFIDMDHVLEQKFQETVFNFVTKNGWKQFRYFESELLKELLANSANGTIVCCGGGVVDTELCRMLLKSYPYVVYFKRDLNAIISNLSQETNQRASLNESIEVTYHRRRPWYDECSKFHFVIEPNENDVDKVHHQFASFLSRVIPNVSHQYANTTQLK